MSIVKTTDFKNTYHVAQTSDDEAFVQEVIDRYESKTIRAVFGKALGNAIIADIGAGTSPANADLKKVWDAFNEILSDEQEVESEGMLVLLKAVIYYHYITATFVRHSVSGVVKDGEDTAQAVDTNRLAESRYNAILDTWEAIHAYINDNLETYPTFVELDIPGAKFSGVI